VSKDETALAAMIADVAMYETEYKTLHSRVQEAESAANEAAASWGIAKKKLHDEVERLVRAQVDNK
jgi:hypothetical protein